MATWALSHLELNISISLSLSIPSFRKGPYTFSSLKLKPFPYALHPVVFIVTATDDSFDIPEEGARSDRFSSSTTHIIIALSSLHYFTYHYGSFTFHHHHHLLRRVSQDISPFQMLQMPGYDLLWCHLSEGPLVSAQEGVHCDNLAKNELVRVLDIVLKLDDSVCATPQDVKKVVQLSYRFRDEKRGYAQMHMLGLCREAQLIFMKAGNEAAMRTMAAKLLKALTDDFHHHLTFADPRVVRAAIYL